MPQPKKKTGRKKRNDSFYVMSDDEMNHLRNSLREQSRPIIKKSMAKFPEVSEADLQAEMDKFIELLVKAIGKGDTRAFNKLCNLAYGKPK